MAHDPLRQTYSYGEQVRKGRIHISWICRLRSRSPIANKIEPIVVNAKNNKIGPGRECKGAPASRQWFVLPRSPEAPAGDSSDAKTPAHRQEET
jgi:hypothetical protein